MIVMVNRYVDHRRISVGIIVGILWVYCVFFIYVSVVGGGGRE